jgi:VIT1/CCC1 family predicted Fe2+/Mn2+ transporter
VTTSIEKKPSFIGTYLEPVDSLSEIIFGLIMVLGFTSTARLIFDQTSAQQLLLAVLGCNLAWGIVDGVMYILGSLYERGQRARIVDGVRSAPDDRTALALIAGELDSRLEMLTDAQRAQVYTWLLSKAKTTTPQRIHVQKDDVYGAIASGLLVFVSVLPVVLPFLIFSDVRLALRLSNLISVLLLFVVGYFWARATRMNQLVAGLLLMSLGLAMVAVTVALGG